jgi:prevent-host-death family protein
VKKSRVVNVTEFKSKCVSMIAEVERGASITVTRRGVPVAALERVKRKAWKSARGTYKGRIKVSGDIVDTLDLWRDSEMLRK